MPEILMAIKKECLSNLYKKIFLQNDKEYVFLQDWIFNIDIDKLWSAIEIQAKNLAVRKHSIDGKLPKNQEKFLNRKRYHSAGSSLKARGTAKQLINEKSKKRRNTLGVLPGSIGIGSGYIMDYHGLVQIQKAQNPVLSRCYLGADLFQLDSICCQSLHMQRLQKINMRVDISGKLSRKFFSKIHHFQIKQLVMKWSCKSIFKLSKI